MPLKWKMRFLSSSDIQVLALAKMAVRKTKKPYDVFIVLVLLSLWYMVIVVNPTYSTRTNLNHVNVTALLILFSSVSLFFTTEPRITGALCSITMISEKTSLKGTFVCARGVSGMRSSWMRGKKWVTWRQSGSLMTWGRSDYQSNILFHLMSVSQIFQLSPCVSFFNVTNRPILRRIYQFPWKSIKRVTKHLTLTMVLYDWCIPCINLIVKYLIFEFSNMCK